MTVSSWTAAATIARNWLYCLTISLTTVALLAQRTATGSFKEFPLPNPGSGPTTIAVAPDGTLWFTEGAGNRIGRMAQDGSGLREFDLPHPGSAPRIITVGSDGNFWFSEHLGNRMGRITHT